jgi:hypothetical protein
MKDLLLNYDANVLKEIAGAHGVDTRNLAKAQVAERLAARLAQRAEIERSLAAARVLDRDILARVHGAGGTVWSDALKRILLNERRLKPTPKNKEYYWQAYEGDPDYTGTPALEDVAARLMRLGLLFSRGPAEPTRTVLNRDMGRELVIPDAVRAVLTPAAPVGGTPEREPSRVVAGSARIFQRDLSRYWSFVRRNTPLELTSQGWLYKKTQTELLKTLGWTVDKKSDEQHTPRLYFIRQLLRALKLLVPPPARGHYPPAQNSFTAADAANFWSRTPHERMKLTFEAWRDGVSWNELRVPPASYTFDHRRDAPAELKSARQVILDHMRRHGAGGWVALPALLDDVRLTHYEFLFPHRASPYSYRDNSAYYQSHNPYGITYKDVQNTDEGWEKVEAVIISHVVTDVLHWLGLTDVGFEGDVSAGTRPQVASAAVQGAGVALPVAYRLTPAGAWLLGIGEEVTLTHEGGRVIVQPNFQIVALEPIVDDLLMTLDEFAQFEGGDQALTYRLTRESVYRGQRAHWDAARIVGYLEAVIAAPLPQNVKRTLEEWDALSRRITIHRDVALLQADEPATLDGLLADPRLAQVLGRRAAPLVALPAATAQLTLEALQNSGWLPHVMTAGTTRPAYLAGVPQVASAGVQDAGVVLPAGTSDASASLIADEEGRIEVAARAPNIYAYGAVAAFVEWEDARHARITPGSVRAALDAGVAVPAILARLKSVQVGELPPLLVQRIKAWGKFYGDARADAFTLIEFRDEAARSELLTDPELWPYLTRFEAGSRPLAAVPAAEFEHVRALLAERGVDVRAFNTE